MDPDDSDLQAALAASLAEATGSDCLQHTASPQYMLTLEQQFPSLHSDSIVRLSVVNDGRWLIASGCSRLCTVHDVFDPATPFFSKTYSHWTWGSDCSPDGRVLATSTANGDVNAFRLRVDGAVVVPEQVMLDHRADSSDCYSVRVFSLCDFDFIVLGDGSGRIAFYSVPESAPDAELSASTPLLDLRVHSSALATVRPCHHVTLAPESDPSRTLVVACSDDGTVSVLLVSLMNESDPRSLHVELLLRERVNTGWVYAAVGSPDGKLIAAGNDRNNASIIMDWDSRISSVPVTNGTEVDNAGISDEPHVSTVNLGALVVGSEKPADPTSAYDVAWLPAQTATEAYIVTGSLDKTLRIYEVYSQQLVVSVVQPHTTTVRAVTVANVAIPDEARPRPCVISASSGAVNVFSLPPKLSSSLIPGAFESFLFACFGEPDCDANKHFARNELFEVNVLGIVHGFLSGKQRHFLH